jgi:uncharacterized repeat protein (TIGR01451 family)
LHPSRKEAQPKGYQAEHFIANDEEIEYTLHFQNEGTDTAFNVVLRDTLDKSLNVNTIRTGTSSHQYDWAVSGSGILTFTFKNIHLTAKKQNEALSQGFVKFRIAQRQGLACGVMIKNRAGIYFDSNSVLSYCHQTDWRDDAQCQPLFWTKYFDWTKNLCRNRDLYRSPFRH